MGGSEGKQAGAQEYVVDCKQFVYMAATTAERIEMECQMGMDESNALNSQLSYDNFVS